MKYLNALYKIPGLGSGSLRQLYGHLQDSEACWNATESQMKEAGIGPALIKSVLTHRPAIDPDQQWALLEKENISLLSCLDENYPALLKEMPNPPFLLYIRGNADCLIMPMIAMVGSRKLTEYGKRVAEKFGHDLARAGLCIVSGLAIGIDAASHRGALDANGKTIAVLGGGVEDASINPRTNYHLAQEILDRDGLIMSEFPIGTPPSVGTFPCRDKTMAGLTLGTLVVEAAVDSGSLITPSHAIEFNREVFAVPGPIFSPQSEGTNNLIKKGAKVAACIGDILEELHMGSRSHVEKPKPQIELFGEEKITADVLSPEPTHIDRITKLTKLETSTIGATLAMLEIKGVIKNIGGQNYIKL